VACMGVTRGRVWTWAGPKDAWCRRWAEQVTWPSYNEEKQPRRAEEGSRALVVTTVHSYVLAKIQAKRAQRKSEKYRLDSSARTCWRRGQVTAQAL
jgi:hypothetical protein